MKIYKVKVNGKVYEVELESVTESNATIQAPTQASAPAATPAPAVQPVSGNGTEVTSPMAGTIVGVNVQVGSKVSKGQTLVILEAMKLENEIVAPCDGTVSSVLVSKGTAVENKQLLVVLG